MKERPPDDSLVESAREGDEGAFRSLLEPHLAALRAQAHRQLPDSVRRRHSESDVLQEASIAAFQDLPRFEDRGPGSFGRWLARIVTCKVRDATRRHLGAAKRSVGREVGSGHRPDTCEIHRSEATPSGEAMAMELAAALEHARDSLPPDYRAVLDCIHGEGLTLAQAGERLGRSSEAARKLYARALSRLTERVPELGGFGP